MNNKKLLQELEKFGFTEPQAKLYLAGLSQDELLMQPLAKKAGIKRTSAYYVMEELMRRGFFSVKKNGKRHYYSAASPQRLIEMTEQREKLIKKISPFLLKLRKIKTSR